MYQAAEQALQHNRELQAICGSIGDQLRYGDRKTGFDHLRFLLDGIGSIAQAIHLTVPLQEQRGGIIDLTPLPKVLEQLLEALRNRDATALADLLTYELEPILAGWAEELGKLTASPHTASHGPNKA